MTSTSMHIGLNGEEKNSSRVLRPPGGGHSDIFGIRDNQNEMVTPSKKRNYPQSTISSCFNMVESEEPKSANKETLTEVNINEDKISEVDNGIDENVAPKEDKTDKELEKIEPEQAPTVSRRVRVPPGGFSSGLW